MSPLVRLVLLLGLPVLAACDLVPIVPRAETPQPTTLLSGTVDLQDFSASPGGDVVLFRYRCEEPPPPSGSGRPEDFLLVPADRFEGGEAPFVFASVPAESCVLVGGFIDRDDDFHYAVDISAQPTGGDVALQLIVRTTGGPEEGSEYIEPPAPLQLRPDFTYAHDGPLFQIEGDAPVEMILGSEAGTTPPLRLDIEAVSIDSDFLRAPDTAFDVVLAADADGDGLPDDLDGDLAPDVLWPQVRAMKLDPDDPSGLALADPPVVLPAVVMSVDPAAEPGVYNLVESAIAAAQPFDGESSFERTRLRLYVPGFLVTNTDPLELLPVENANAAGIDVEGDYALLVMNPDGRFWRLPNLLATDGYSSQAASIQLR